MINRSVAGVVCPVAGVILTVVARGKSPRSCGGLPCGKGHAELCSTSDLQVHSDWVIGDCPFACRIVADHSLMSGVMHSLAGIMDCKADCVQFVACLFTIHSPVWKFQHYTCQWMCTFSGTGQHMNHL